MLQQTLEIPTGSIITPTTQTEPCYSYVKDLSNSNYRDLKIFSIGGVKTYSGPIYFSDLTSYQLTDQTNYQNQSMVNGVQESTISSNINSYIYDQPTPVLLRKLKRVTRGRNLRQEFDSELERMLTDPTNYQNQSMVNSVEESTNSISSNINSYIHDQPTPVIPRNLRRVTRGRNLRQEFDSELEGMSVTSNKRISWVNPEEVSVQSLINSSKHSNTKTTSMSYFPNSSGTPSKQPDGLSENDLDTSRHISFTIPSNRRSYLRRFEVKQSTPIKESFRGHEEIPDCSPIPQWSQPKTQVLNSSTQTNIEDISDIANLSENANELDNFSEIESRNEAKAGEEFNFRQYITTLTEVEKREKETQRIKAFNNRNDVKRYFNFNDYCKRIYNVKEQFDKGK